MHYVIHNLSLLLPLMCFVCLFLFYKLLTYHLLFCLCYIRLSFFSLFTYPPLLSLLHFLYLSLLVSSPPPPGFLQITPEGSPQAQRRGEVGGEANVSGSFCLHTSELDDFTTKEMSEEHQVSSTEEGTVTMMTKTTRITRQMVTTETRTGESSTTTTTTRQASDFNY